VSTERLVCDAAVVGAGPAGLAAAEMAARCGAKVVVLDLFAAAGGQYHMQPPARLPSLYASHQARSGREALRACELAGVRILTGAEVFWVEPGFRVLARRGGEAIRVDSAKLIVATGASERVLPFKGWTLPGVITAGAAQRLVKTAGTPPGRRIVLAGSGPFLLAVAATFASAGIGLTAYVEAARPGKRAVELLARFPERAGEAAMLALGVAKTGGRRLVGHIVTEALGDRRVEAVRVAPIGPDGAIRDHESEMIADVDALCVGYGFRPAVEITSVLGADHVYDERLGGWACLADPTTGGTRVPGLHAAGEVTGLAGAQAARLSGILAGSSAARGLGLREPPFTIPASRLMRRLTRARRFAANLAELFPLPDVLLDRLDNDEVVCRCEDVTKGALLAASHEGARDALSAKMWTRAGMGPCQGRICGQAVASLLARANGVMVASFGRNRPHLPLRPTPLDIVAAALIDQ
jgi:NADPH-dependent 2,4-dienoyl-CoA reductase/sulfur reductase-like enzyme